MCCIQLSKKGRITEGGVGGLEEGARGDLTTLSIQTKITELQKMVPFYVLRNFITTEKIYLEYLINIEL